jgi:predicted ATPase with chaperone activity
LPVFDYPKQPVLPVDTGIGTNLIQNLMAKIFMAKGVMTGTQISQEIKLSKQIVNVMINEMVKLQIIESRGLESSDIKSDIRYALTIAGNNFAHEAMRQSQYDGPAPVTLDSFVEQVALQSIKHEKIHREELKQSLTHLVLSDLLLLQLGPAANSARSVLLYGEPGNGKTSIAEALGSSFQDIVYFPYAISVANQVITFYDENIHSRVETSAIDDKGLALDPRWVACKRPVVVTGGELNLEMLDLAYNAQANFYEAPIHVKALGGIFIVDDFGRQQVTPREILNRWIVPLEQGVDYLTTHTGRKITVPFDQLVVFSTNMMPEELSDAAALRRIHFKIYVESPTKDQYIEIFRRVCEENNLAFEENVISTFFDDYYTGRNFVTSGAHPNFMIDHVIATCIYHDKIPEVTRNLLELAWRNVAAETAKSIGT